MMDFSRIDRSYRRVREQLDRWKKETIDQLEQSCQTILNDLDETLKFVENFIQLIRTILIEQENQLNKTTINDKQFDLIEQRIEQILREIQCLECSSLLIFFHRSIDVVRRFCLALAFQLNIYSIELKKNFRLRFNNDELSTIFNRPQSNFYRFLISRCDVQLIKSKSFPMEFHFDESTFDCVLTFDVFDLDEFLRLFEKFSFLCENSSQFRLLIPEQHISFITGSSGERLKNLQEVFHLNQIKTFPQLCPKSDERILFIEGIKFENICACIEEIYYNLNDRRKQSTNPSKIRFYRPSNFAFDTLLLDRHDYGGFLPIEDENTSLFSSDDDELCSNGKDSWWDYQPKSEQNFETIERTMSIDKNQAGVIIGMKASRIDRIKQKSGAYVYINSETKDMKRTVVMRGTREQVDRVYRYIEHLIEKHRQGKFTLKRPQRLTSKVK